MTLTLTAGATNAGTTFAVSGTNDVPTDATNLAAVINQNLSTVALDEIAAVALSGNVTVYALTAGTGVTLSAASNLSNFSWGAVTAGKNGSQANIVGLNNLYSGSGSPFCTGHTYPTFMFSYAAGVGAVSTSPVLSLDGRKVAFIESDLGPSIGTILHVLTLGTGTELGSCSNSGTAAPTCATAPVIPGSTPGSNATDYMLPLDLLGSLLPAMDNFSSPFLDYSNDVLYVGDDSGSLFSVSPVFMGGSPVLRSGFPVQVNATGGALSSPVVDVGNTSNVFVEDGLTRLYSVTDGGVVQGYIPIGYDDEQFNDGPLVDSTNGVGYAVATCTSDLGSTPVLIQFATIAAGSPEVLATADLSASECELGPPMFNATPDNNYFTKGISSSSPSNNGELLVAYENSPESVLAQLQFSSGTMNSTAEYTDTDDGEFGNGSLFSPLTEFYGHDQAYNIGAVTQNGNTVTVTTTANAFVSNQIVVISSVGAGTGGCTSAAAGAINGEQTVTVTSPATFTFTSPVNATIGGADGNCGLTGALATGPTQDYLFIVSTLPSIYSFDLPLTSATQTAAATNTTSSAFGVGGTVVDNDSSDGQASSIYFVTSGPTSAPNCDSVSDVCAVKLTQAGLN
jgi:hypothetical protein